MRIEFVNPTMVYFVFFKPDGINKIPDDWKPLMDLMKQEGYVVRWWVSPGYTAQRPKNEHEWNNWILFTDDENTPTSYWGIQPIATVVMDANKWWGQ